MENWSQATQAGNVIYFCTVNPVQNLTASVTAWCLGPEDFHPKMVSYSVSLV